MAVNQVTLSNTSNNISISKSETKVTVLGGAEARVVATRHSKPNVTVTAAQPALSVTQGASKIVQISDTGPQGPPFSGATFFNVGAISALGAEDIGKVVAWDGTEFRPTDVLENELTISGGNF